MEPQSTNLPPLAKALIIVSHGRQRGSSRCFYKSFLPNNPLLFLLYVVSPRLRPIDMGISGLVAEYIVAIDVTRVRFPADAIHFRMLSAQAWIWARWLGITHPYLRNTCACVFALRLRLLVWIRVPLRARKPAGAATI